MSRGFLLPLLNCLERGFSWCPAMNLQRMIKITAILVKKCWFLPKFIQYIAFRHEAFKSLTVKTGQIETFLRFLYNQTKGDKRAIWRIHPPKFNSSPMKSYLPKKQRIVFGLLNCPNANPPLQEIRPYWGIINQHCPLNHGVNSFKTIIFPGGKQALKPWGFGTPAGSTATNRILCDAMTKSTENRDGTKMTKMVPFRRVPLPWNSTITVRCR